jgi:amino acid transporter
MTPEHKLKPACLNFSELLAQNIALISPTMTAALIVPLMFSNSGNLSWVSYLVGTIMLMFVAFNLNQFAKRSTGAGSMYTYTSMGLGPTFGSMSGWCLMWSYLFIGLAGTTGFTVFAGKVLDAMGIHIPDIALFAICICSCFILAYKDIVISTIVMLILEAVSCTLIIGLCCVVLASHGTGIVDSAQFDFHSMTWSSLGFGVVVAVFSLVGFESSTAFGEEAKNPLKTIPRSIIWSLVLTGVFFIFVSYVEVLGAHGAAKTLDTWDTPLNILAVMYKVPWLAIPLSLGAMVSFYALALSCMNAGARVMFAMSRHGAFHECFRRSHKVNETPHVAIFMMALLMFGVVAIYSAAGRATLDAFNDAGTMGAFGFCGAYALVCISAPLYLKKIGELKAGGVALSVAGIAMLGIPAYGVVFPSPTPTPPDNYFPAIFGIYLIVGLIRAFGFKIRDPKTLAQVREELTEMRMPGGLAYK